MADAADSKQSWIHSSRSGITPETQRFSCRVARVDWPEFTAFPALLMGRRIGIPRVGITLRANRLACIGMAECVFELSTLGALFPIRRIVLSKAVIAVLTQEPAPNAAPQDISTLVTLAADAFPPRARFLPTLLTERLAGSCAALHISDIPALVTFLVLRLVLPPNPGIAGRTDRAAGIVAYLHIPDDPTDRTLFMAQRIVVSAHPVTASTERPSRHPACHGPEFTTPAALPP